MQAIDYARSRAAGALALAFLGALLAMASGGGASAWQTESVLYTFCSQPNCSDGANPYAGLIANSSGNLYGTTRFGGGGSCPIGCGVVFKLSPDGTETVLHSFSGGADGGNPYARLIADSSGNLYGTTSNGGRSGCIPVESGCGVVFKLAPDGTSFTVLYAFAGGASDGATPYAGVIADSSRNLYGTTHFGGPGNGGLGWGVVFKLAPDGTETVLYSFCSQANCSDGNFPDNGVVADSSRNLYGTATGGGASNLGTVFELSPDGTSFTVLHSFAGGAGDGANPFAGLIADSSGNLYGTTAAGGASTLCAPPGLPAGCGTVFKLSPGATFTLLHSFTGGPSDGASPGAGLIADSSGNLYGTTSRGGASTLCNGLPPNTPAGCGTVFKLSPDGTETLLHSFAGDVSDGADPTAGLIADSSGNLYGTTGFGGGSITCAGQAPGFVPPGCGVVFKLTGTGFVAPAPILAFRATLEIEHNSYEINASFTLSSTASIDPLTQPVTLSIGPFTTTLPPGGQFTATIPPGSFKTATIPPGSFRKGNHGVFSFEGTIDGVSLKASIKPTVTLSYSFFAEARGANLARTKNPVPVTLTIGNNSGTTSVKARFLD
jgi:uncharacterized repeat protein (TIGR03803 family)